MGIYRDRDRGIDVDYRHENRVGYATSSITAILLMMFRRLILDCPLGGELLGSIT